ncbi:hypothetical protein [Actinacidiphila bryophytorum]|uniref:Uncharacterized protein n=1 Tax=Actinacidiphila bryophytorum TaxID=1436133 RepID=A0A9W4EDJ6_9ACTN|nr:hypothetical protein [Actinacidiphila bryophytorum]MBM9434847.1 hypothetical protein [Actinacidiphila bryophytorum]MBN6545096.1 hypothetical protein [Actinacidiphila bryophytorum]CAG7630791.1 conserved exported hypothetical protein [Actinacidiphila bryophytorum]
MRKLSTLTKSSLVTGAAMAAAIGLAASPASAAGTWTVTGGGSFTASASHPILKDSNTGTTLDCTSSAASGSAANGTGLSGTNIATISGLSFTGCTGPAGISFTVAPQGLPWHLNAASYDGSDVTTGTLTGVIAKLSGLCNATFAGTTSSTSPATLTATYTNSTHTLAITGGSLKAYSVSGICLGLINNNDLAVFTGKYVVTPSTLKLTSP